jgi:dipeptidyl aminopeptidase/acylaminoacyl peptidase
MASSLHARFLSFLNPVFIVLLIYLPQTAQAAEPAETNTYEVKEVKGLTYCDGADSDKDKHKLDLYLPKDKKDFPVLFFVHGGAWVHGDRSTFVYRGVGRYYASQGIGTVVISYRLSPGVKHPEHIKDVASAFAWTVKNIEKYGGKPDQIFISGHSAGGHLVALLGTDESYLKAEKLSFKNIKAVIPLSGVYEIPAKLLSQSFGTDEEVCKKASPTCNVKEGLPPYLIVYADDDMKYCDKEPAQAFYKALKDKGCDATICEIPKSNHLMTLLSAYAADGVVSKKVLEFIHAQTAK